jgi:sulfur-carrier protein
MAGSPPRVRILDGVAAVRLFASARETAGTGRDVVDGQTVAEVVEAAAERYGASFRALLPTCRIWLNGEAVDASTPVGEHDEVAFLPPVSGG